jgi:hypothetical protein
MRKGSVLLLLGAVSMLGICPVAQAAAPAMPATYEGLVKVESKKLTAVYLLPDADFRGYTKVMIDPVQVSFHKDWMKNINRERGMSRRIDNKDAQEIADSMRSGFEGIFKAAFEAKGYQVVTAPAADVLRLSPAVVNLYINAPDPMGVGVRRTYTVEAGEATLTLAARDSTTGALLGIALDRGTTRGSGRPTFTSSVPNRSEFEELFGHWANICVKGRDDLKARPQLASAQREKKQ